MKLNDLRPAKGAIQPNWRRGQGPGSGNGKTGGRGANGQRSRSGSGRTLGFEGGQMPLYRRLPKRGFHNHFRKEYSIVNLDRLSEMFEDGAEVTIEEAIRRGLLKGKNHGLKILGDGELSKKITIHAHKASASARQKIEAAGGQLQLVGGEAQ